jgi:hypothetical protein
MNAEARAVAIVERWFATFHHRWPEAAELDEMLTPDAHFVERPNLVSPGVRERDRAGMEAGIAAGREVLAWQSYEPLDHVVSGDTVVTRLLWKGELAIDAGQWEKGTLLTAWCVAHFALREGRIAHIEQHDCYEPPVPPR